MAIENKPYRPPRYYGRKRRLLHNEAASFDLITLR